MAQLTEPLVWLDLEMTGLDVSKHHIIEIATIVTDGNLNIIAEGPNIAIYQDEQVLGMMDEWCQTHHTNSGLVKRIQESQVSEAQAQDKTLAFLEQYVKPNTAPLCGNSICTDRRFLYARMPKLEAFFHYRMVDVSSIKELAKRWAPSIAEKVKKQEAHLALADIHESIEELRFYREHLFNT